MAVVVQQSVRMSVAESIPESHSPHSGETGSIGGEWDSLSPEEEAMETLLDDFMQTLMAATMESLGKDRDNDVIKELKAALRATEVEVVKEALFEADYHSLAKHRRADEARIWLAELKVEVALFDEVREQRRVTDETHGATHLTKLLAKASDLNMEKRKSKKHKKQGKESSFVFLDGDGGGAVVGKEEAVLANRMANRSSLDQFSLDAYTEDEDAEEALDRRLEDDASVQLEKLSKARESANRKAKMMLSFRADDNDDDDESDDSGSSDDDGDENSQGDDADVGPGRMLARSGGANGENDGDDEDDDGGVSGESAEEESEEEDENGVAPPPRPIDMPSLWRMRVPRHTKLLKECLHHLKKCTARLELTADEKEVALLHRRLRLVCVAHGEAQRVKRAMVELKVMTEVMHLDVEDPSPGNKRTALHYAAGSGNEVGLRFLLRRGARMHAVDDKGNNPLHLAAANNHSVVCQVLVYKGSGTARQRIDGANVLHVAAMSGSTDACRALLSFSASAASATQGTSTGAGSKALVKKGTPRVESVGPQCVGVDVRRGVEGNSSENSALLCAAMGLPRGTAGGTHGFQEEGAASKAAQDQGPGQAVVLSNAQVFHEDTVRLLLDWGADLNLVGEHGTTLLHLVCAQPYLFPLFLELVEEHCYTLSLPPPPGSAGFLLSASAAAVAADVKAEEAEKKNKKVAPAGKAKNKPPAKGSGGRGGGGGDSAEASAKEAKAAAKKNEAEVLAKREAEVEANRIAEEVLLHRMRHKRHVNVNGRNGDGNTPLHVAIYNHNVDVSKLLLMGFKCSCDLSQYLLDLRRVRNPLEAEPLCACPSPPLNVNLTNDYGFTSLHVACRHHDLDLIKLLLSRKANKNRLATLSGGPLHMACTVSGAPDIVSCLLKHGADVRLRNNQHGRTALHTLCCDSVRPWDKSKGCLRPFQPLLSVLLNEGYKADDSPLGANDQDREGRTPLALAVLKAKRLKTVQFLLDHRISPSGGGGEGGGGGGGGGSDEVRTCNPDVADKQGITPLAHAVSLGRMDLILALLDASEAAIRESAGQAKGLEQAKKKELKEAAKKEGLQVAAAARARAKTPPGESTDGASTAVVGESGGGQVAFVGDKAGDKAGGGGDGSDGDEKEGGDGGAKELLGKRGCLTAQDVAGSTVFHLAANMPRTNPGIAVVVMRTLMDRLTKCPPGLSAWTAPKQSGADGGGDEDDSSSDDEEEDEDEEDEEDEGEDGGEKEKDASVGGCGGDDDGENKELAAEDDDDNEGKDETKKNAAGGEEGGEIEVEGKKKKKKKGGAPSADVKEEWHATEESEETAWHVLVRHKMTKAEIAAAGAAADASAAMAAQPETPNGGSATAAAAGDIVVSEASAVSRTVVEVAHDVLKVMLSALPFNPSSVLSASGGTGSGGDAEDNEPVVRLLDMVDADGETCLQAALASGNLSMARLLLEFGETHNLGLKCRTIRQGRTSLVTACDLGLLDEAGRMIDLGARINEGDRKGFTPLMACCRLGVGGRLDGSSLEAQKRLRVDGGGLETGSAVVSGDDGGPAAEVSAEEEDNKAEMLSMLLEKGADPNKVTEDGDTALHFICEQASSQVQSMLVTRLIEAGADPKKVNRRMDTPLHLAIETCDDMGAKSKAVVEALCQAKAPTDVKNRKRRTPCEHAVALEKPTLASIVAKFDEFAAGLELGKKKKKKKK